MPDPATIGGTDALQWIEPIVYGLAGLVLLLFLFVPFAVFGSKRLLREQRKVLEELLAEQRRSNELLFRLTFEEAPGDAREPAPPLHAEPDREAAARREPAGEAGRSRMSLVVDRNDRVL